MKRAGNLEDYVNSKPEIYQELLLRSYNHSEPFLRTWKTCSKLLRSLNRLEPFLRMRKICSKIVRSSRKIFIYVKNLFQAIAELKSLRTTVAHAQNLFQAIAHAQDLFQAIIHAQKDYIVVKSVF